MGNGFCLRGSEGVEEFADCVNLDAVAACMIESRFRERFEHRFVVDLTRNSQKVEAQSLGCGWGCLCLMDCAAWYWVVSRIHVLGVAPGDLSMFVWRLAKPKIVAMLAIGCIGFYINRDERISFPPGLNKRKLEVVKESAADHAIDSRYPGICRSNRRP